MQTNQTLIFRLNNVNLNTNTKLSRSVIIQEAYFYWFLMIMYFHIKMTYNGLSACIKAVCLFGSKTGWMNSAIQQRLADLQQYDRREELFCTFLWEMKREQIKTTSPHRTQCVFFQQRTHINSHEIWSRLNGWNDFKGYFIVCEQWI